MNGFAKLLKINVNAEELIAGISTSEDKILTKEERLHIVVGKRTWKGLMEYALSHVPRNANSLLEDILCNAVCAVILYGVSSVKLQGVSVKRDGPLGIHTHDVKFDISKVRNAMTLICATKINYFATNSHIGGTTLTGFPLKVFNALYNPQLEYDITPELSRTILVIGNWAETNHILRRLGVTGICKRPVFTARFMLRFSDDFNVRSTIMPAGTAGLGICYAIMKRLKFTGLKYAIEDVSIIERIYSSYHKVRENQAAYHPNAVYLTNENRMSINDDEFTQMLGLLGSFIVNVFPNSTICKSPKLMKGGKPIYKEYETYSESFEALCISVKKAISSGIAGDIESYLPTVVTSNAERILAVDGIFKKYSFI